MQTKTQLIYNDVCAIGILALIVFNSMGQGLQKKIWVFLFIYSLGKQIIAHIENYKLKKQLF